jgi:hypothetical protein
MSSYQNTQPLFTVVIRSAGERTTNLCKNIVCGEVKDDLVHLVKETPFEEALKASYSIGIKSNAKWLVTIDADVIPKKGFTKELNSIIHNVPDKLFSFKLMIFDKFFQKHRLAGFRVYRCSLLKEALSLVPSNGEQIRPEQYTVNLMEKRGYKTKIFEYVVGLHDFEQFYRDIYRKAFFHATKHPDLVAESLTFWKKESAYDKDYIVMIKGVIDGLLSYEKPTADIRFFDNLAQKAISDLGLHEKDAAEENLPKSTIQLIKKNDTFFKEYSIKAAAERVKTYGKAKGIIHHFGYLLETTGKLIQKKINAR